jgi:acetolactate synthase-1/2/3 large subunit
LRDNRRAEVELFAQPAAALRAMLAAAADREPAVDRAWARATRAEHEKRAAKLRLSMATAEPDARGRMHPNRLLAALQKHMTDDAVLVADGGDFLSFARVGLNASTYLDPGPLGCIGVGTPFGVAASLAFPGRQVVVATGDGAFGFNAMEIDTAVRHGAKLLIVVANNGAWQIEVTDQQDRFQQVIGTRLQFADHAAMARAFGMHGQRVERVEDLDAAITTALQNLPALLDVVVSTEARSSDGKSGLAWVPDLQAVEAWDTAERQWRGPV